MVLSFRHQVEHLGLPPDSKIQSGRAAIFAGRFLRSSCSFGIDLCLDQRLVGFLISLHPCVDQVTHVYVHLSTAPVLGCYFDTIFHDRAKPVGGLAPRRAVPDDQLRKAASTWATRV